MKKIALIFGSFAIAASMFGQGALIFNNRLTASGVVAPVYGVSASAPLLRLSGQSSTNGGAVNYEANGPRSLLRGSGYTAELWAGTDPIALAPLTMNGKTTFRTGASTVTGFIQTLLTGDAVVPFVITAGTTTHIQLRVWKNNDWRASTSRHNCRTRIARFGS